LKDGYNILWFVKSTEFVISTSDLMPNQTFDKRIIAKQWQFDMKGI